MEKGKKKSNAAASAGQKKFGWPLTAFLAALFLFILAVLWALFVSGPARVHEEEIEQTKQVILDQVPGIQDLDSSSFAYLTWQGYDTSTLYWFDAEGVQITTREISSLDYQAARQRASQDYGMDASTIVLAYGYSAPVYLLESDQRILMLDYDTLTWVYERNKDYAGSE